MFAKGNNNLALFYLILFICISVSEVKLYWSIGKCVYVFTKMSFLVHMCKKWIHVTSRVIPPGSLPAVVWIKLWHWTLCKLFSTKLFCTDHAYKQSWPLCYSTFSLDHSWRSWVSRKQNLLVLLSHSVNNQGRKPNLGDFIEQIFNVACVWTVTGWFL